MTMSIVALTPGIDFHAGSHESADCSPCNSRKEICVAFPHCDPVFVAAVESECVIASVIGVVFLRDSSLQGKHLHQVISCPYFYMNRCVLVSEITSAFAVVLVARSLPVNVA
jgi:hypothetical protein